MNRSAQFYETGQWKLPAYKKVLDLYNQLETSTKKARTNIKRGIIFNIENLLIEMLSTIVFADEAYDDPKKRSDFIDSALENLHKVVICVRILKDLNAIHPTGFSALTLLEDNVSAQLTAWKCATAVSIEEDMENK